MTTLTVIMTVIKSASCQVYNHVVVSSSSSETSGSSSSASSESSESDTPLKRFNRLLRSSVARHWDYFRKDRPGFRSRGRSVSDAGLCDIVENGPDLSYLDIAPVRPRRSLQVFRIRNDSSPATIPAHSITTITSTSGGTAAEEASDSEAERERPRRHHQHQHLRVPTPALPTQSTGNFTGTGGGGGCGAPRSAPATPLQLEPHPHPRAKHDKHALKPLSGSAPSVAVAAGEEATDGKQPSKSRQKKFQRHFPQVGPEERVLNYYSCALVGDLLLQGHLYITKNYFAFYSNVFGYVTKLLIPITSVLRITKEKVARIIPNAVGVCTRDERHVFGSLLSRDSTYKLMTHVWKAHRLELAEPKPDLRASEVDLDASEYSPEDDSSSGGGERHERRQPPPVKPTSEVIISAAGAAVIQPALLTGSSSPRRTPAKWRAVLMLTVVVLTGTATVLAYKLYSARQPQQLLGLSGEELYGELVRVRARLHGRAAADLHAFLTTNLLLITKVRQSLEALSGVILPDSTQSGLNVEVPNDTAFS